MYNIVMAIIIIISLQLYYYSSDIHINVTTVSIHRKLLLYNIILIFSKLEDQTQLVLQTTGCFLVGVGLMTRNIACRMVMIGW